MNMQATFINDDGSETTYQGEQAWSMLQAQSKPYSGVSQLKQIPSTKENYRGKNAAGGRKATFSQSRAYRNGPEVAMFWHGLHAHQNLLKRCREARAELVQAIAKGQNDATLYKQKPKSTQKHIRDNYQGIYCRIQREDSRRNNHRRLTLVE